MLFLCYGLLRALQAEVKGSMDLSVAGDTLPDSPGLSWQQRLSNITHFYGKTEITAFLDDTARSALEAVAAQMRDSGLTPEARYREDQLDLDVPHGEHGVFRYTIRARSYRSPSFAWAETDGDAQESRHYRAMAYGSGGDQQHDVTGYTRDQLINDLLNRYARFRHLRRLP
jgi:choline/glycine/proline betaine transport protein